MEQLVDVATKFGPTVAVVFLFLWAFVRTQKEERTLRREIATECHDLQRRQLVQSTELGEMMGETRAVIRESIDTNREVKDMLLRLNGKLK